MRLRKYHSTFAKPKSKAFILKGPEVKTGRVSGTVSYFTVHGFGRILPDGQKGHISFHFTDIISDTYRDLHNGDRVEFDLVYSITLKNKYKRFVARKVKKI